MRVLGAVLIAVAVAVLIAVLVYLLAILPGQRQPLAAPTGDAIDDPQVTHAPTAGTSVSPSPAAIATPVSFSALTTGTCLTDAHKLLEPEGAIDKLEAIDCSAAHYEEVIALGAFQDGAYPGADALIDQLDVACVEAFSSYVGIGYGSSELSLDYLLPTESSWHVGDRGYACLVFAEEPLVGSVAGSAR
jgi:hypothetical protein